MRDFGLTADSPTSLPSPRHPRHRYPFQTNGPGSAPCPFFALLGADDWPLGGASDVENDPRLYPDGRPDDDSTGDASCQPQAQVWQCIARFQQQAAIRFPRHLAAVNGVLVDGLRANSAHLVVGEVDGVACLMDGEGETDDHQGQIPAAASAEVDAYDEAAPTAVEISIHRATNCYLRVREGVSNEACAGDDDANDHVCAFPCLRTSRRNRPRTMTSRRCQWCSGKS